MGWDVMYLLVLGTRSPALGKSLLLSGSQLSFLYNGLVGCIFKNHLYISEFPIMHGPGAT